jgi:hypothetical protein
MSFFRRLFGRNAAHAASRPSPASSAHDPVHASGNQAKPLAESSGAAQDAPLLEPPRPSVADLQAMFGLTKREPVAPNPSGAGESPEPANAASDRPSLHIGRGRGGFKLKVIGESFYQSTLQ